MIFYFLFFSFLDQSLLRVISSDRAARDRAALQYVCVCARAHEMGDGRVCVCPSCFLFPFGRRAPVNLIFQPSRASARFLREKGDESSLLIINLFPCACVRIDLKLSDFVRIKRLFEAIKPSRNPCCVIALTLFSLILCYYNTLRFHETNSS